MNVCMRWRVDLLVLDWERRYIHMIYGGIYGVNRDEIDGYGEKFLN